MLTTSLRRRPPMLTRALICVALPPIGTWTPADKAEEVARIANDGLKELCDKYPANWSGYLSHSSLSPSFAMRATSSALSAGVQVPIGGSATQMSARVSMGGRRRREVVSIGWTTYQ